MNFDVSSGGSGGDAAETERDCFKVRLCRDEHNQVVIDAGARGSFGGGFQCAGVHRGRSANSMGVKLVRRR